MINQTAASAAPKKAKRPHRQTKAMARRLAEDLVMVQGRSVLTTSIIVGEKFGKQHKNVLQAIRNLECSEEFSRLNFQPSDYVDERGKARPMMLMTRQGFSRLVMRFTGKTAGEWQDKFVDAFFLMQDRLTALEYQRKSEEWQFRRRQVSDGRNVEADSMQRYVVYATAQGSKNAGWYFSNLTLATYRALFNVSDQVYRQLRERMSVEQLPKLEVAERLVARTLDEGMDACLPYKEIYAMVEERLRAYAGLVGVSDIPADILELLSRTQEPALTERTPDLFLE